ncbi:hypothetical protein K2173_020254 [Erythroxylum novogranatense]|uniref:Chalcone isomerase n=1 Tax=Erythroxylum novogranatense TaxID=1862640 RepID=A0AAV8UA83_9ROSI|nr:hypothetical protein K2173_020254 [Erythroxylum novogranatense]
MAAISENVIAMSEEHKVNGDQQKEANGVGCENGTKTNGEPFVEKAAEETRTDGEEAINEKPKEEEEVAVEVEPKTGVSFPVKLDDGKQLISVGLRKKSMLGLGIKIYGFGMYADGEKLKEILKLKIEKAPAKPTKELYQLVIDSDVPMTVRMVVVFSSLTMNMVKKNFDEGLGASIKKLTGGKKNDELVNMLLGQASDDIKLSPGSMLEISRLPGYLLQAKGMACIHLYLGDDPLDKDAKEKFGMSLLSFF